MASVSVHSVEAVFVERPERLSGVSEETFVRRLVAIDKNGERFELVLFSGSSDKLDFMDTTEASRAAGKLSSKIKVAYDRETVRSYNSRSY